MTLREWRNESELGAWTHLELIPATHGSMVESVWLFEGTLQEWEQFYPTGTLDLLIQLEGSSPSFRVIDGQSTETPAAALTGMLLGSLTIETPLRRRSCSGRGSGQLRPPPCSSYPSTW